MKSKEFILEKAIRLAAKTHRGQKDRFKKPFILHVMRVIGRGTSLEEQVLGALHDVVERSDVTVEDLREKGFPERILLALDHISRREGESYVDYIDRIELNHLATRVKIHDLADKMDISKIERISDDDRKRFNRQLRAYHKLQQALGNIYKRLDSNGDPEQEFVD